jgi:hypothetical protein
MIKKFEDLVTSIDILNTINGGISEPFLSIRQQADGREVRIRVPGIDRERLKVEIINNKLSVFYLIPILSDNKMIHMPQVIYNLIIPYFIEVSGIKGVYEGSELVVKLPFNKRSSGYNRKIEIDEE